MNTCCEISGIAPEALAQMMAKGERPRIVDVSTPAEFASVRVPTARNLPIDSVELESFMLGRKLSPETSPLYVMCRGGVRSLKVCERYPEACLVDIQGGTRAWAALGLPLVKEGHGVSLQRQVQMTAGGMVAGGAVLAVAVNPWFVAICGMVGAGLMYAGISDTCAMGALLEKMPWNRAADRVAHKLAVQ